MRRLLLAPLLVLALAGPACLGGDDATPPPVTSTNTTTSTPTDRPVTLTPRPRTPTPAETPRPTETPTPTATPRVIPTLDPGKLPMKILNYANPLVPDQLAFITLVSELGATCSATLTYSKQDAGPERLGKKEISPVGQVDWTWKVQPSPAQQILVTATCQKGAQQGVRRFTIQVQAATP